MRINCEIQNRLHRVERPHSRGSMRVMFMLPRWLRLVVIVLPSFLPWSVGRPSPRLIPELTVHPGDDIGNLVRQKPPGTVFRIQAGVHRLQSIIPKDGDLFIGVPGAILSGAQLLSGFSRFGRLWTVA